MGENVIEVIQPYLPRTHLDKLSDVMDRKWKMVGASNEEWVSVISHDNCEI